MQGSLPSENNYLYYVIEDSDHKVRGHIIGTQHNVDKKDKDLNPVICDAIKRSSRAILEMPPNSKLLPSSDPHWMPSPEWVIDREFKKITLHTSNPKVIDIIEKKVDSLLEDIKKQTSPEDYKKVSIVIEKIQSSEDKLTFVQAILVNISEFNEVSLEENINKKIQSNEKCEILPLENIDLGQLLEEARSKVPEEKVDEETKIRRQALQERLYKAWVEGDAEELKKTLDECFLLYPEAPEFEMIHAPRDANIAQRIVDVIKKDNKESLIVVGDAHLLYSKRKNVMEYLDDHFKSDLSGWSIRQIKKNDIFS